MSGGGDRHEQGRDECDSHRSLLLHRLHGAEFHHDIAAFMKSRGHNHDGMMSKVEMRAHIGAYLADDHPHLAKIFAPSRDCKNSTNCFAAGFDAPSLVKAMPVSR